MKEKLVFFSYYKGIMPICFPDLLTPYFEIYYVMNIWDSVKHLSGGRFPHQPRYFAYHEDNEQALAKINEINPSFVIAWNGWYKSMQKDFFGRLNPGIKVVYVEWGWLPQDNHISVHRYGTNAKSDLVNITLDDSFVTQKSIDWIEQRSTAYLTRSEKMHVSNYIFIPLQLDGDTQLIFGQAPFKTQKDFVSFVRSKFPNRNIVVKLHPRSENSKEVRDWCHQLNCVFVMDTKILDWIHNADFVVGINSTSLIESIFMGKPTAVFGLNAFSNKDVALDCHTNPELITELSNFDVNGSRKWNRTMFFSLLYSRQFYRYAIDSSESLRLYNLINSLFDA